ncbi:hypothetical protein TrVE_jg10300 [Triparma verrucosa]|uniref:Uncharacterized protein n=1 Tax=Triparma verrucosa TaxID=1606542 RepID=A0A9W7C6Y4_9STRA|nr:hypothetical protein TrVE_jg10300 [Triparma verrucosa]
MHLQAKSDQSENSIDASNTSENMFFEACAVPSTTLSNNNSYREGDDTASHFPASYSSPPKTNATGASNPQMQTPSPVMIGGRGGGGGRPKSFIEQMDVESVLEQMTNEIRTAGLRKGRENALVELVAEVRASCKDYTNKCKTTHKEWVQFSEESLSYAGLCRRDKEDMISFMENLKMELAKRERRVEEALKEAEVKRDQSEKECIAAKEEAERVKKESEEAQKKTMEDSEQRLQREIAKVKARLIKEAEKKASKCVEGVSAEYGKKLNILKAKLESSEKVRLEKEGEVKDLKGALEAETRKYKIDLEEWQATSEENEKSFESLAKENQGLMLENNKLNSEVSQLREQGVRVLGEQREKRRAELDGVEQRVKGVIRKKDELIRKLLERAERAEKRALDVERVLLEIDSNFTVEDK